MGRLAAYAEYGRLTDPAIMEGLLKIRGRGIRLSLDDFGIGYSPNLTCLENLPFQLIKIDQSLVTPIASKSRARQLLEGVVALGHGMGFRLLAEGVETQEVFHRSSIWASTMCRGITFLGR